jgi:hypothetical protein
MLLRGIILALLSKDEAHIYRLPGSAKSNNCIVFSYIVNTMPPLNVNLPSRGNAPDQNVSTPSFLQIIAAQWKLFLYTLLASKDCILVFTVSNGIVEYTVTTPAMAPKPKVVKEPSFSPGATYPSANCLREVYVLKRTAEFAAWRAVVGTKPWKNPLIPFSLAITAEPCRKPRIRGCARFRSSTSCVFIDSEGVTASNDSVTPAPNPAATVRGPDICPFSSESICLYVSKARNRTPALTLLPITAVVQPVYHSREGKGGQGTFLESGRRRLSWERVFSRSNG